MEINDINDNERYEEELKNTIDKTYESFKDVLENGYADEEQKKEIETKVNEIIKEFKQEYQDTIRKMGGTCNNPDLSEKLSRVEKQITELEKKYEIDKSEDIQEFLNSIHNARIDENLQENEEPNGNYKNSDEDRRTEQEADLADYMEKSSKEFDDLLNVQAVDELDKETMKANGAEAIALYEQKFKDMSEKLDGSYRNPDILNKENEIKDKIEQLKTRYDIDKSEEEKAENATRNSDKEIEDIAENSKESVEKEDDFYIDDNGEIVWNKERNRDEQESIRDDSVRQDKDEGIKEVDEKNKEDEEKWNARFKDYYEKTTEDEKYALKKDEALKYIKDSKTMANEKKEQEEELEEDYMRNHGRRGV